jgi:hypothetical protein
VEIIATQVLAEYHLSTILSKVRTRTQVLAISKTAAPTSPTLKVATKQEKMRLVAWLISEFIPSRITK